MDTAVSLQPEISCRRTTGYPIFIWIRSVVDCKGSKIEHLLNNGYVRLRFNRSDLFDAVLRRLLRDKRIPVDEFSELYRKLYRRYGPTDIGMQNRGCYFNCICLIGDIGLKDGMYDYTHEPEIGRKRDMEFKRKKYSKLDKTHLAFLKSSFELNALVKKLKERK